MARFLWLGSAAAAGGFLSAGDWLGALMLLWCVGAPASLALWGEKLIEDED